MTVDTSVQFVSRAIEQKFARKSTPFDVIEHVRAEIEQQNFQAVHNEINPSTIYCKKTGQPIGQYSANVLSALIKQSDAGELAHYQYCNAIAPQWIRTNGKDLQQLKQTDPFGFFVYACAESIKNKQPGYVKYKTERNRNDFIDREAEIAYCRQKVELYNWLVNENATDLILRANDAWAVFLGQYNPNLNKVEFSYNSLMDFANLKTLINLPDFLRETLKQAIIRVAEHEKINSQNRFTRAAGKLEGYGNFKQINRAAGETDSEFTLRVMQKMGWLKDYDDEEIEFDLQPRLAAVNKKLKQTAHAKLVEEAAKPAVRFNIFEKMKAMGLEKKE